MVALSLKIGVGNVVKTMQFEPSTMVYDACRIIRERVPEAQLGQRECLLTHTLLQQMSEMSLYIVCLWACLGIKMPVINLFYSDIQFDYVWPVNVLWAMPLTSCWKSMMHYFSVDCFDSSSNPICSLMLTCSALLLLLWNMTTFLNSPLFIFLLNSEHFVFKPDSVFNARLPVSTLIQWPQLLLRNKSWVHPSASTKAPPIGKNEWTLCQNLKISPNIKCNFRVSNKAAFCSVIRVWLVLPVLHNNFPLDVVLVILVQTCE